MKGITQQLRELATGEQISVSAMDRSNLHKLARRVGIKIKVEKYAQIGRASCRERV